LKSQPFELEFFGTPQHVFASQSPREHPYYSDPTAFEEHWVTWGNKVFTNDANRRRMLSMPRPIRQSILFLKDDKPRYRLFDDGTASVARFVRWQRTVRSVIIGLAIATLAYPVYMLCVFLVRLVARLFTSNTETAPAAQ
jgi:hypothetical protein